MQSVSSRKNCEQTTSRIETSKRTNDRDGERNASDTDDQENEIQNNPFGPSGSFELGTPVQSMSLQNFD